MLEPTTIATTTSTTTTTTATVTTSTSRQPTIARRTSSSYLQHRPRSQVEFSVDQFNLYLRRRQQQQPNKCDYYFSQPYYPYYYRQYYLNNFGIGIGGKYRLASSTRSSNKISNSVTYPLSSSSSSSYLNLHSLATIQKHPKKKKKKSNSKKRRSSSMIIMNNGVPRQERFTMKNALNSDDNVDERFTNNIAQRHEKFYHIPESFSFLGSETGSNHEDEHEEQKNMAKKFLLNGERNGNGGFYLNRTNSNTSQMTMPSCTISISGNHHQHIHPLFGSSTITNSMSQRSKSLKMILCSYVLTTLVLLIIIGISFACGLLASQYIYKPLCDSSYISSNPEIHVVSSNSLPFNQRIIRNQKLATVQLNDTIINNKNDVIQQKHILSNSTYVTYQTNTIKPITMHSNNTKFSGQNLDQISKINEYNITNIPNYTTVNYTKIFENPSSTLSSSRSPTSTTATVIYSNETLITTTTIQPLEEQKISTTLNPDSNSTISGPANNLIRNMNIETTTITEKNIFSTLIDQYNQALNETVQQVNNNVGFLSPIFDLTATTTSTTNSPLMDILDSNKTKLILLEEKNNNSKIIPENDIIESTIMYEPENDTNVNLSFDSSYFDNITDKIITSFEDDQFTTTSKDEYLDNEKLADRDEMNKQQTNETLVELIPNSIDVNMTDLNSNFDSSLLNQTETESDKNSSSSSQIITSSTIVEDIKIIREENLNETQLDISNGTNRNVKAFDSIQNLIDLNNTMTEENVNNTVNVTILPLKEIETPSCLDSQFQCPNSTSLECIDKFRICDGIIDCPNDQFDELDCWKKHCGMNFQCGRPIMFEQSTTNLNSNLILNSNKSSSIDLDYSMINQTQQAKCVPRSNYCDGIWDCDDGSDELECHIVKCDAGKVPCRDNSACITGKQACDGVYNCRDRSDEAGCGTKSSCESIGKFYCDDSALCISKSLVCDGIADCDNGADEKDCMTQETCKILDGKFFCQHSMECIDMNKRCDGRIDCIDYSDEDHCLESDLDNYVYAYNGHQRHWSLLCIKPDFDQNDADQICSKMGMAYAKNFSIIPISRLLNGSTWAIFNSPMNQSLNISNDIQMKSTIKSHLSLSYSLSFESNCEHNQALMVECEQLYCDSGNHKSTPDNNAALNAPEEVPIPIFITNSMNKTEINNNNSLNKCLAYTLSPKWLLASGQCLINLKHDNDKNLLFSIGEKIFPVNNLRIHPKYSIFRTIRFPDYDMALVEIREPLPKTLLNHSSICLPNSKLDPEITCFIGNYHNGDTAFKVLESSFCNSTKHFSGSLTNRHVCATSTQDDLPETCLPPYLPLICLSSHSHWYIAGFTSYQHGCHPITGRSIFHGYFSHPTLFSNLFTMKTFIDQTLGIGSYRRDRIKIDELDELNSEQSFEVNGRAVFVVAGSEDDQNMMMIDVDQKESLVKNFTVNNGNNDEEPSSNITTESPISTTMKINDTMKKVDLFLFEDSNAVTINNNIAKETFEDVSYVNNRSTIVNFLPVIDTKETTTIMMNILNNTTERIMLNSDDEILKNSPTITMLKNDKKTEMINVADLNNSSTPTINEDH